VIDIESSETGSITTGNLGTLKTTGTGIISARTNNGGITIGGAVTGEGEGTFSADANGVASDINVNSSITTNSKTITLRADNDVIFSSAGNLIVTGGAKVTVQADADNGAAANSGALTMHANATISSGTGVIDLDADESLTITGLKSTNTGADAIQITSRRGAIVDAGDSQIDITAENGGVNLRAVTGIGSTNALEVSTGKSSLFAPLVVKVI
jgi:hypothetical protein